MVEKTRERFCIPTKLVNLLDRYGDFNNTAASIRYSIHFFVDFHKFHSDISDIIKTENSFIIRNFGRKNISDTDDKSYYSVRLRQSLLEKLMCISESDCKSDAVREAVRFYLCCLESCDGVSFTKRHSKKVVI